VQYLVKGEGRRRKREKGKADRPNILESFSPLSATI